MFVTDEDFIVALICESDVEIAEAPEWRLALTGRGFENVLPISEYLDVTFAFRRAIEDDKRDGYAEAGTADAGGY